MRFPALLILLLSHLLDILNGYNVVDIIYESELGLVYFLFNTRNWEKLYAVWINDIFDVPALYYQCCYFQLEMGRILELVAASITYPWIERELLAFSCVNRHINATPDVRVRYREGMPIFTRYFRPQLAAREWVWFIQKGLANPFLIERLPETFFGQVYDEELINRWLMLDEATSKAFQYQLNLFALESPLRIQSSQRQASKQTLIAFLYLAHNGPADDPALVIRLALWGFRWGYTRILDLFY